MPDFLHDPSETASNAAPGGEMSKGRPLPIPASANVSAAAPAAGSSPVQTGAEGGRTHRGEMHGQKRKSAPVIFTHYYGAFFLFIVAMFLGGGYLLLAPSYAKMNDVAAETGSDTDALQREQAYLAALNNSISAAEAIPKDVLARVDEAIPYDNSGIPKLLVTMSEIAKQSNVDLGSIQFSPGSASEVSGDSAISLSLVPTGISTSLRAKGYQEMRRYLTNLEQSLRLIDVDSITVSGGGGAQTGQEKAGDEFSYSLQMTAYSVTEAVRKAAPTQVNQAMAPTPATADAAKP